MTTITALPQPPSRSDPVNFAARGDAFLGALPTFATEANALSVEVNANAISAANSASFAGLSAANAASSSQVALAAANFKGLWSSLTGALSKPATVKHNNRFWLAVDDIADVTASEPGVSSDWTSVSGGVLVQRVSTDTVMMPGVLYVVEVPAVTLTAPVLLLPGDVLQMSNATSANVFVDFNGQ